MSGVIFRRAHTSTVAVVKSEERTVLGPWVFQKGAAVDGVFHEDNEANDVEACNGRRSDGEVVVSLCTCERMNRKGLLLHILIDQTVIWYSYQI